MIESILFETEIQGPAPDDVADILSGKQLG